MHYEQRKLIKYKQRKRDRAQIDKKLTHLNWFERWMLRRTLAKAVKQGDHMRNIGGICDELVIATRDQFTEDNKSTIDSLLRDKLQRSLNSY